MSTGTRNKMKPLNSKSGQVLLIAVMLLAVTLTIVLSITFSSRTDTQLTKLEQDNQKALAAAEAGIEAALKSSGSISIGGSGILPDSGFSGSASVTETYTKTNFITPLLEKDEQYTFYMGAYDKVANTIGASTPEDLTVCFGTPNQTTKTAVEITVVKGSGSYTLTRYLLDPENPVRVASADIPSSSCSGDGSFSYSTTIDSASIGADTKLVLVRILYASSKVRFSRTSTAFPSQGKFVSSEATSNSGVSKKVELFQSYPQIPADLFVTSF